MRELDIADPDDLDVVFANNRQYFIRLAERITGSRSYAEDIVHDAFVKIIDSNPTNVIGSYTGYLVKIIRNAAIDHYRKKSMETRALNNLQASTDVRSETLTPDHINIHRQALQTVATALAELPERTRYAFEMHRIHGLSQKEIANTLGVSPTLVNFMIRDAMVHCRKKLKGDEEGE